MTKSSNVSELSSRAVASPRQMPRKPKKLKPNHAGLVHVSVMLEAELVRDVDAAAVTMKDEDPFKRPLTRTDALRQLLREALSARTK